MSLGVQETDEKDVGYSKNKETDNNSINLDGETGPSSFANSPLRLQEIPGPAWTRLRPYVQQKKLKHNFLDIERTEIDRSYI